MSFYSLHTYVLYSFGLCLLHIRVLFRVFFYFISFAIHNSFDFVKYQFKVQRWILQRCYIKTLAFNISHQNIAIETYSYAKRKRLDFKKELVAYLIPYSFFPSSSSWARSLSASNIIEEKHFNVIHTLCLSVLDQVSFRFVCEEHKSMEWRKKIHEDWRRQHDEKEMHIFQYKIFLDCAKI